MNRRDFLSGTLLCGFATALGAQPAAIPSSAARAPLTALAFSPSGQRLAAGGGSIGVYEAGSRQETGRLSGHAQTVLGLAWLNEEELLSWGVDRVPGEDRRVQRVRWWRVADGELRRDVEMGDVENLQVAFRLKGEFVMYWTAPNGLFAWRGRKAERTLPNVRPLALDEAGQRLLYADGGVHVFDIRSRRHEDVPIEEPEWAEGMPGGGWVTFKDGSFRVLSASFQEQARLAGERPRASSPAGDKLWALQRSSILEIPGGGSRKIPLPGEIACAALHAGTGMVAFAAPGRTEPQWVSAAG